MQDPVGAHICVYREPYQSTEVHCQCGLKIGDYVITTANEILMKHGSPNSSISSLTIMYTVNNDSGECIEQKEGFIETIWQSKEIEQTMASSFKFSSESKQKLSCCSTEPHYWSYFVLIKIKDSPQESLCNNLQNHYPILLQKGMDVIVNYTPFGSHELINSVSQGIVSKTFGANTSVFLTDARLAPASEGAPVFRNPESNRLLIGIIVQTIPYMIGGVLHHSGFTIAVNISVLFNSLQNHMASLKPVDFGTPMDLHRPSPNDVFLKTNFVVYIDVGTSQGIGVIIHESGLVITCAHVVNFSTDAEVTLKHQDNSYDAKVLYSNPEGSAIDIAILMISSSKDFPSCKITSECPKRGDSVYSVGQGLLFDTLVPFMSKGIVSNYCEQFIFTTCLTLHGSSGGVIMTPNGEVIALITSMLYAEDNTPFPFLSFCIPIYYFYDLIHFFIHSKDVNVFEKLAELDLRWKTPRL